jgi:hypothetical protein
VRVVSAAFHGSIVISLIVYLFAAPLEPTAWGGPRGAGPFEEGHLPAAGRWARDARLALAELAGRRSPDAPLPATAEALAGFHALLAVARFGFLWLALRRVCGCALLATTGVAAAALPLVLDGPDQADTDVGLLLFAALLAATTPSRLPWWTVYGLPALFALWANAHASAVVGLAWLGAVTLGRTIEWWKARDAAETARPAVGRLLLALGLCAAAACLNPDGPRLFADAFRVTKNPNVPSVADWQPLDFSAPGGMPWAYFATLAALFLAQLASPRGLGPTTLVVLLTFGFWPLVQQRGLEYWWLIAPWLAVPVLAGIIPVRAGGRESISASADWRPSRRRLWAALGAITIILAIMPVGRWLITGRPRALDVVVSADTPWRVGLELTARRDDAGRFLPEMRTATAATYPAGRYRGAILCREPQGDFLAWVLDGDNTQPVMTYSRPETLGPLHWAETHRALDGAGDWWEILARHQVNLIVIDPGRRGKLADRVRRSPEWLVLEDGGPGELFTAIRRVPKLPIEP